MLSLETKPPQEIARALYSAGTNTTLEAIASSLSKETAEQTSALLLDISAEEQQKREQAWLVQKILVPTVTFVLMGLALIAVAWLFAGKKPTTTWGYLIIALINSLQQFLMDYQSPAKRSQQAAAVALAEITSGDPRALAVLLDTLPSFSSLFFARYTANWEGTYGNTLRRITEPLWNAGEECVLTLTESRRHRLRGTLYALWKYEHFTSEYADFCAAAIKALATVGDMKSIQILKKISQEKQKNKNREFLRDFAKGCLVFLRENAEKNQVAEKSLRKVSTPASIKSNPEAINVWLQNHDTLVSQYALLQHLKISIRHQLLGKVVSEIIGLGSFALCYSLVDKWIKARTFIDIWKGVGLYLLLRPVRNAPSVIAKFSLAPTDVMKTCVQSVGDIRLIPTLIDIARLVPSRGIFHKVIAEELRRLKPGDAICFAPRHLAFLREFVWTRTRFKLSESDYADSLTASVYALGVLGDGKATKLLTRILETNSGANAGLREEALNALRRINDIREWRDSLATTRRKK